MFGNTDELIKEHRERLRQVEIAHRDAIAEIHVYHSITLKEMDSRNKIALDEIAIVNKTEILKMKQENIVLLAQAQKLHNDGVVAVKSNEITDLKLLLHDSIKALGTAATVKKK